MADLDLAAAGGLPVCMNLPVPLHVRPSLVERCHTRQLAWESSKHITAGTREGKRTNKIAQNMLGTLQVRVVCRYVVSGRTKR